VDKILYQTDLPNFEARTAGSNPCRAVMKILLSLYPPAWLAVLGALENLYFEELADLTQGDSRRDPSGMKLDKAGKE